MTTPLGFTIIALTIITLAWWMERRRAVQDAKHRHPAGKWKG